MVAEIVDCKCVGVHMILMSCACDIQYGMRYPHAVHEMPISYPHGGHNDNQLPTWWAYDNHLPTWWACDVPQEYLLSLLLCS